MNVKRLLSCLLAVLLLLSALPLSALPVAADDSVADSTGVPTKAIAFVYDNSGSMRDDKSGYAEYASRLLASVLNEQDSLCIIPMNVIGGISEVKIDLDHDDRQTQIANQYPPQNSSGSWYKPKSGGTPYRAPVDKAVKYLNEQKANNPNGNTDTWLVIMTDGVFDEIYSTPVGQRRSKLVDDYIAKTKAENPDLNIIYFSLTTPDDDAESVIRLDKPTSAFPGDPKFHAFHADSTTALTDQMNAIANLLSGRYQASESTVSKTGANEITIDLGQFRYPLQNIAAILQNVPDDIRLESAALVGADGTTEALQHSFPVNTTPNILTSLGAYSALIHRKAQQTIDPNGKIVLTFTDVIPDKATLSFMVEPAIYMIPVVQYVDAAGNVQTPDTMDLAAALSTCAPKQKVTVTDYRLFKHGTNEEIDKSAVFPPASSDVSISYTCQSKDGAVKTETVSLGTPFELTAGDGAITVSVRNTANNYTLYRAIDFTVEDHYIVPILRYTDDAGTAHTVTERFEETLSALRPAQEITVVGYQTYAHSTNTPVANETVFPSGVESVSASYTRAGAKQELTLGTPFTVKAGEGRIELSVTNTASGYTLAITPIRFTITPKASDSYISLDKKEALASGGYRYTFAAFENRERIDLIPSAYYVTKNGAPHAAYKTSEAEIDGKKALVIEVTPDGLVYADYEVLCEAVIGGVTKTISETFSHGIGDLAITLADPKSLLMTTAELIGNTRAFRYYVTANGNDLPVDTAGLSYTLMLDGRDITAYTKTEGNAIVFTPDANSLTGFTGSGTITLTVSADGTLTATNDEARIDVIVAAYDITVSNETLTLKSDVFRTNTTSAFVYTVSGVGVDVVLDGTTDLGYKLMAGDLDVTAYTTVNGNVITYVPAPDSLGERFLKSDVPMTLTVTESNKVKAVHGTATLSVIPTSYHVTSVTPTEISLTSHHFLNNHSQSFVYTIDADDGSYIEFLKNNNGGVGYRLTVGSTDVTKYCKPSGNTLTFTPDPTALGEEWTGSSPLTLTLIAYGEEVAENSDATLCVTSSTYHINVLGTEGTINRFHLDDAPPFILFTVTRDDGEALTAAELEAMVNRDVKSDLLFAVSSPIDRAILPTGIELAYDPSVGESGAIRMTVVRDQVKLLAFFTALGLHPSGDKVFTATLLDGTAELATCDAVIPMPQSPRWEYVLRYAIIVLTCYAIALFFRMRRGTDYMEKGTVVRLSISYNSTNMKINDVSLLDFRHINRTIFDKICPIQFLLIFRAVQKKALGLSGIKVFASNRQPSVRFTYPQHQNVTQILFNNDDMQIALDEVASNIRDCFRMGSSITSDIVAASLMPDGQGVDMSIEENWDFDAPTEETPSDSVAIPSILSPYVLSSEVGFTGKTIELLFFVNQL
ncbi:MAG: VWA domain-containing protein [Clostridia bacterium]|nr:VWA domain-containing protein [Clostridia bacterium]